MIIVGWNIRAGGGRRIEQIAAQLAAWRADIVALSEYRGTPASVWLAKALAAHGLVHQATTASAVEPARNGLLVASRWPVAVLPLRSLPTPRQRVLPVRIDTPAPMSLIAVHSPLGVTGHRRPFNDRLLAKVAHWRYAPGMLIGDTNTGKRAIDEQSAIFDARDDVWMDGMNRTWPDAFRHLHGQRREYTWYSPNKGNGFRLDQAFVHRALLSRVTSAEYRWGSDGSLRREALSDHAAIVLSVDDDDDGR